MLLMKQPRDIQRTSWKRRSARARMCTRNESRPTPRTESRGCFDSWIHSGMTLEEVIVARLRAFAAVADLVADRVFADDVPSHTTPAPWLVYSVPTSEATDILAANLDSRNTLEVAVYSESKAEAVALRDAVRTALHTYRLQPVQRVLWESTDSHDVGGGYLYTITFKVWCDGPG